MEGEVDASIMDLGDRKSRYKTMVSNAKTVRSHNDCASQYADLQSSLQQLDWDLEDMSAAVSSALEHPEKFALSTAELVRREDAVQQLERKSTRLREEIEGVEADRRRKAPQMDAAKNADVGYSADHVGRTSEAMMSEMATQETLKEEQDEALERLTAGVRNVKHKAVLIGDELKEQDKMLNDLDKDMSQLELKIEGAVKKIGALIDNSSDKKKMICIIVLMFILAFLVFLMMGED